MNVVTSAALLSSKIPTKSSQPGAARAKPRPGGRSSKRPANGESERIVGATREATRGEGVVVEVAGGVTVYPARVEGDRWRATWYEGGRRECESVSESGLAARLVKVTERLTADAPGLEEPGSELIAWYLSPWRHPADRPWSRKHADAQARLCRKYLAPVIDCLRCEDIKVSDMQAAVNAAPTAGEGDRLARCISALVNAGIDGGYLTSPRLRNVRWQPGDRPASEPRTSIASECVSGPRPVHCK